MKHIQIILAFLAISLYCDSIYAANVIPNILNKSDSDAKKESSRFGNNKNVYRGKNNSYWNGLECRSYTCHDEIEGYNYALDNDIKFFDICYDLNRSTGFTNGCKEGVKLNNVDYSLEDDRGSGEY